MNSIPNGSNDWKEQVRGLRVALVHYWYLSRRGGERVLEVLAEMFPEADIFTLMLNRGSLPDVLRHRNFTTSFLQRIPGIKRHYKKSLVLWPLALEQFRLRDYDLVISHESGPAKGVLTGPRACHICYAHTPMRYVWDMYHEHLDKAPLGVAGRVAYALVAHYLRQWDSTAANRVDYFAASSRNGATRIWKTYRRESHIIYPPVDVRSFSPATGQDDYYLVVSPLVPYKRINLAIVACNRLRRRLLIIGSGEELKALQRMAGPTISFLGYQPDAVVRDYLQRCRALLFPGEEDIGLTPIEAQACGRPVIALGKGGALETVVGLWPGDVPSRNHTGVFFPAPSADSLVDAIARFESIAYSFVPEALRAHVLQFDTERFKVEMGSYIAEKVREFRAGASPVSRVEALATTV